MKGNKVTDQTFSKVKQLLSLGLKAKQIGNLLHLAINTIYKIEKYQSLVEYETESRRAMEEWRARNAPKISTLPKSVYRKDESSALLDLLIEIDIRLKIVEGRLSASEKEKVNQ